MNLGSKNIKFTIKKIVNDLNDFDKINDFRSFSIAQNIRRKTLRYIIANKKLDDQIVNSDIEVFNKLAKTKLNNLIDFLNFNLSDSFKNKEKINISHSSTNFTRITNIAKDILNISERNEFNNFTLIIHGSQANGEVTNYSDIDISIFLKDKSLFNQSSLEETFMKISLINMRISYWDRTGHHSSFLNLESDLECYAQSFMPINVLKLGVLPKKHKIKFKNTRKDLDLLFEGFFGILKTIIQIVNKKGYLNPIGLKQLLSSYFMLVIYEFEIVYEKYLDKKQIFLNEISRYFDEDDYKIFTEASKIREKWPNQKFNNYIGISEKFIFDLLSHIKKISENIQNDQILQKLADLYLK